MSIGESPLKCAFRKSCLKRAIFKDGIDGNVDSIQLNFFTMATCQSHVRETNDGSPISHGNVEYG